MNSDTKFCLVFFMWTQLLYNCAKTEAGAGSISSNNFDETDGFDDLVGKSHNLNTTINNLGEETSILVGYQNPWEIDVADVVDDENIKRSQTIHLKWPKAGVPIFYNDNFTKREKCFIELAIKRIQLYSCIPLKLFVVDEKCSTDKTPIEDCLMNGKTKWSSEKIKELFRLVNLKHHVVMTPGVGCLSSIGQRSTKQIITLNPKCFNVGYGTVIHETLHSLGYHHEHTRQDRDNYIKIVEENIKVQTLRQFGKANPKAFLDFGPYDFYSLMHYGTFAFRKAEGLRTIFLKNTTEDIQYSLIGQRVDLTDIDKAKIRAVTQCSGRSYEEHVAAVKDIDKENVQHFELTMGDCEALK